ncbi:polysaccharide deacetylase family protein [Gracilibacillus thailandensis]|uniref:Polysaccharide deacetylase family protein n=1 Tax=Gracilibacillus thailandensis TaxID=563735 RepID=A0A6N7R0L6_9BACI|nr:polysaccharide deacetylase family protein [Gracilibacillus thailandensis]MRI66681.1 polysaccharide deacetylase family protein [Gracilibacillus thailandensis]
MVKKSIFTLLLGILLILGACSDNMNDENEVAEGEEANTEETSTDQTEKENEGEEEPPVTEDNEDNKTQDEKNIEEEAVQEITEPLYKIDDNWNVVPLDEGTNEKVVLLTIDDAPEKYALEMAQTLKKLEAPAIFFVNGHFLETDEKKEQLRQIHEMGFAIGNHTYHHQKLSDVDEETQKQEIMELNDLIEEITGQKPKFFRAPHGENTDYATSLVEEEGMLLMNWTYGYDYFEPYMDAEKLKEAMISGEAPEIEISYSLLKPGANLLMHDREWTAAALEDIVKGLRDKGYEFVDPMTLQVPE